MLKQLQPALVSVLVLASSSFAQMDSDENTTETTENVHMQMNMPGMPGGQMNMKVKVRQTTTTTSTPAEQAPAAMRRPMGRDCGTGEDSGCTMRKNGKLPMDKEEFSGFLQALRSNDFELQRHDMVKNALRDSLLTAKQLGLVLDVFENEINRFDVAKIAAPKLVNPKHALGHSSKFENSIYASDYTNLMTSQR